VITGGFAEAGEEGARLQAALAEAAGRHGVRVLGPNCQGINNPHHRLCASWPLLTARGAMAVVSQSGTVGAALMDWAAEDGLGVSCFAALGNRAVVDEADLIFALGRDPHTRAIALYLEGIKDPAKFAAAARQCPAPLVALKPGRTPRGRAAAESHTKSLAGDDAIYDGFFRQHGIHRAEDVEDLYDTGRALAYLPRPRGRRLLIVTSSGGCGVLAMDAASVHGIETPPPSPTMAAALRAFLPAHCIIGNPLDLTGDATADWYRRVSELAAPHYDAIAPIFGDPIPGAADAVGTAPTPCVICLGGGEVERAERRRLHANAERLRRAFRTAGLNIGRSSTQIVPVILGEPEAVMGAARALEAEGILAVAIRPPTVPEGTGRIRFALSSAHDEAVIARVIEAVPPLLAPWRASA